MLPRTDYLFKSFLLKKFISSIAYSGCYFLTEKLVYKVFEELRINLKLYKKYFFRPTVLPVFIFFEAVFLCRPVLHVKIWKFKKKGKKKLGKKGKALATKVIPINITRDQSYNLAIRWIIQSVRLYSDRRIGTAILNEWYQIIVKGRGVTREKKRQLYNLIVMNRSFAHFRW